MRWLTIQLNKYLLKSWAEKLDSHWSLQSKHPMGEKWSSAPWVSMLSSLAIGRISVLYPHTYFVYFKGQYCEFPERFEKDGFKKEWFQWIQRSKYPQMMGWSRKGLWTHGLWNKVIQNNINGEIFFPNYKINACFWVFFFFFKKIQNSKKSLRGKWSPISSGRSGQNPRT